MLKWLFSFLPSQTIYDHHDMQMAAHTVIRMTQMIMDMHEEDQKQFIHQLSRLTRVKEEHAELLKHELRVLYGDYFKAEHLEKYPELSDLVFKTLKLASKARQEINMEAAEELLGNTQKIAEIFFETKGLTPKRVKSPYPTEREIVIYEG